MPEQLLTYREAAERLNISERTLRRMIPDKIKPITLGSHTIRFRLSDLERLIATFNTDVEQN
ncbi:MAG: DNA-binding protein [Pirellula sp.]|nr:DNA-binding protein [Pirellula sp.]